MLSHVNREGGRQQGSFSSLLMSVFSRSEPTTKSHQPQHTFTGASTTFHNVLEVGVGSNVVKLTLSESGLKTERIDALGKSVAVHYGLTKIEWYAVDDATGELLIQYHEFNTDDKYQVAFRSPQYRAIWDCFCHYLALKGEKLAHSQKERELARNQYQYSDDAIASVPSPGGSPAVPSHHNSPTSGDHDYYQPSQPTCTTASPSVGRSSSSRGAGGNGPTKKMPALHLSPRITVADLPSAGSPSLSPLSKSYSPDGVDASTNAPLIVLPPPPRSRTVSPSVGRVPLPPGPVSPSFSAFQSPSGSFDMPALPSPGLSTQRREDAFPSRKPAEPAPSAPAFDLINW